jgi:DNA ligase (NAD+)
MDIRGLGGQRVQQLNEAGLVDDVADLYELRAADLENLQRFAARAATQLIDAIEASKTQPLSKLLFALGIEHVGGEGAKLLAGTFGTMDALMAAREEDLASIDGIGDKIGAAVVAFFAKPKNRALIKRLRRHGLTFAESAPEVGTALAGQTFVITGTLPNLSRAAAKELIERSGGQVVSSVSKSTTALVVGEAPGGKLERAKALGLEILDEAGLLRRIGAAA